MKEITEISDNYDMLVDSFGIESLIHVDDDDYQGSTYILLRDGNRYGILIFGWGSCSGCDTLQDITDNRNKIQVLKDLNEYRDEMYDSITWRSRHEMIDYISAKDFKLEWYGHSSGGLRFIKELKDYSF